jgi:hypothetical protein
MHKGFPDFSTYNAERDLGDIKLWPISNRKKNGSMEEDNSASTKGVQLLKLQLPKNANLSATTQ